MIFVSDENLFKILSGSSVWIEWISIILDGGFISLTVLFIDWIDLLYDSFLANKDHATKVINDLMWFYPSWSNLLGWFCINVKPVFLIFSATLCATKDFHLLL